jgi:iron-sulfur cluster repair protein YtfE (RIC family)
MARYHTVHRNELPHLIRLAQRVEALHPGHLQQVPNLLFC